MPTNYGDNHSLEMYMDCLGKLHALMTDSNTIHTLIAGDFNCSPGSRFFGDFKNFVDDNNLVVSDINRLRDVYTYISDDYLRMSWVDHVLTSISLDEIIGDIHVLDNIIVSDHKPISFSLNCEACMCAGTDTDRLDAVVSWLPNWQQCDEYSVTNYRLRLDNLLQEVHVPWYLLSDLHVVHCSPADIIDTFYRDVIACITTAVCDTIPVRKSTYSQFNVPGWNTFVREKHDLAREAYIHWKSLGKPKTGTFF